MLGKLIWLLPAIPLGYYFCKMLIAVIGKGKDKDIHPKQLVNTQAKDLPPWAREAWEKDKDTKPLIVDNNTTQEQLEAHLRSLGIDPKGFKTEKKGEVK